MNENIQFPAREVLYLFPCSLERGGLRDVHGKAVNPRVGEVGHGVKAARCGEDAGTFFVPFKGEGMAYSAFGAACDQDCFAGHWR